MFILLSVFSVSSLHTNIHMCTSSQKHSETNTQDHLYRHTIHVQLCGLAVVSKATRWRKSSGLPSWSPASDQTTHTYTHSCAHTHTGPIFCLLQLQLYFSFMFSCLWGKLSVLQSLQFPLPHTGSRPVQPAGSCCSS